VNAQRGEIYEKPKERSDSKTQTYRQRDAFSPSEVVLGRKDEPSQNVPRKEDNQHETGEIANLKQRHCGDFENRH
jgi:hypothetical protein